MKDAGKKFIPYEKLSKREKRKADLMQRGTWYGIDPVTKKVESGKRYRRHDKHRKNYDTE